MSRLPYSVTMSLDGFIAGPEGDVSWLTEHLAPDPAVDELIDQIDALLVGNRTFHGDDPHKEVEGKEGKAFGGGGTGRSSWSPTGLPTGLFRASPSSMTC